MTNSKLQEIILNVLESLKYTQFNIGSSSAREILTKKIISKINENNT